MIAYPNVKLNLGLHVVRRREDGYHDLETLFVPYLGLHDTLEIITGDDFSRTSARLQETYGAEQLAQGITPDGKLMVTIARKEGVDWDPLKDLTVKAYGLLSEQYKLPPMKVYLEKTSPVGAGLGGGSADAAFALRMIAEIAELSNPLTSTCPDTGWTSSCRKGFPCPRPTPTAASSRKFRTSPCAKSSPIPSRNGKACW